MAISAIAKLWLLGSFLTRATSILLHLPYPKMDESLRQQIRAAGSKESMEFPQQFKLPYGDAYVDASVCCGPRARPLSGVANQPEVFPNGSFLQLPEQVKSYQTANEFIRGNMPGCEMKLLGGVRKSGSRLESWTLSCKCHGTAKKIDPNDFKDGCVSRKGIKTESVKRSDYDHMRGCIVEATEGKKAKRKNGKRNMDKSSLPIKKKPKVDKNRTGSYRAKDTDNRRVNTSCKSQQPVIHFCSNCSQRQMHDESAHFPTHR